MRVRLAAGVFLGLAACATTPEMPKGLPCEERCVWRSRECREAAQERRYWMGSPIGLASQAVDVQSCSAEREDCLTVCQSRRRRAEEREAARRAAQPAAPASGLEVIELPPVEREKPARDRKQAEDDDKAKQLDDAWGE